MSMENLHPSIRDDQLHRFLPPHLLEGGRISGESADTQLLDHCYERLRSPEIDDGEARLALEGLFASLRDKRQRSIGVEWQGFIEVCRRHPLRALVHQDPFTFRAFSKPRGYAGDALMLDYIYGREEQWPPPSASLVGRRVFDYTTSAPASEGVRARRAFVARLIDSLAADGARPDVLSIAAGHLREAGLSIAVRRKELGRFVALDADEQSLREVARCFGAWGVETVAAKFTRLFSDRFDCGEFDLIYSTGLFDYLAQGVGQRLVASMFERLRPGGALAVANFMPGIEDVGYMEAYMDWRLIYRTREEMLALAACAPQSQVKEITILAEETQNIIFLVLRKR